MKMETLYSIVGISRQAHYKAIHQEISWQEKEYLYVGLMYELRELHPGMGLRKMYEQCQTEGIGRDAWIALGLKQGFRLQAAPSPQITTRAVKSYKYSNLLNNKVFTDVNQLWVSDIFYFGLQGKHYYGILIMDVYSRKILGYSISDNMRAENNLQALKMALDLRGVDNYNSGLIHHSDRGSQYMSDSYTNLLDQKGICISVCYDVLENAHCERVNGTIKNEYLSRWNITSPSQLPMYITKAATNYNNRYHNSIKMSPNQYEEHLKNTKIEDRTKMEIFTINKTKSNPYQLELWDE